MNWKIEQNLKSMTHFRKAEDDWIGGVDLFQVAAYQNCPDGVEFTLHHGTKIVFKGIDCDIVRAAFVKLLGDHKEV